MYCRKAPIETSNVYQRCLHEQLFSFCQENNLRLVPLNRKQSYDCAIISFVIIKLLCMQM